MQLLEVIMEKVELKHIIGLQGLLGWILAGIIAIVISSVFVLIYNYSGTHITNPSGATDYKWPSKQYKAQWSEGINYMHMDANGFNNLSSDTSNVDILLMGSSHMEAIQFPTKYSAGALMNDYLTDSYTYNIGISGHQLINCLDNLEAAVEEYKPNRYVVIETDNIDVSEEDLIAVRDGNVPHIPSYNSGLIYQLQRIPAIKVVYKQLTNKLSIDRTLRVNDTTEVTNNISISRDDVLKEVLNQKAILCADNHIKLVLCYMPHITVDSNGVLQRDDDTEWTALVKGTADQAGILMIDCFDAAKAEYEKTYELPYGFNNATMGEGHLNITGHRIVAQEIAKKIEEKNA